jgi:putative molybdopterin biosynthesis protein
MDDIASLHTSDQLRAVADANRLAVLRLLMARPARLTDLGAAMARHPAWVRHHLLSLVRAGLVELVETRKVANRTEKWYRATSDAYSIHLLLVPDRGVSSPVLVLGSDDVALGELARQSTGPGSLTPVAIGSLDGLIALRQGLADMAGCHLVDPDGGEYNASYVRRLFPDRPVIMFTLAHREQGLITAPGNPLDLRAVEDVARPSVRFVARNPGSGTRLWVDRQLRAAGVDPDALGAGTVVATTHSAATRAVARGDADATVAVRAVAEAEGLDYSPLFFERYDLVVAADRVEEPAIATIIDRLGATGFRRRVGTLAGYDPSHTGDAERVAV